MKSIENFYKNCDIFITGGLGFIGKVLIEKLLRSCSDLNKIFILIRGKNDLSAINRLELALKLPLFDKIRCDKPDIFKKIIPIIGDISLDNLGMSNEDIELLKNVSIIFHSAATVRFDETLKDCILINTKGTLEILKFAEKLENLKSFVHVSTTFCNLDREILEEKIYPPYADWKTVIDFAINSNEIELNNLIKKYAKYHHNNYTLSKHLSEQICNDYKNKIPLVVFRPAIVVPSSSEPIPGWIDNFYGPIGLCMAGGIGLVRCFYADPDGKGEYTAVDVCVKIILLTAYKKALENDRSNILVYNCSDSVKTKEVLHEALTYIKSNPYEKTLWVPNCKITNSITYFNLMVVIFQFMPAILIDMLLLIFLQKPFLTKLQKKIRKANITISKFASGNFRFVKDNLTELEALIKSDELENFSFISEVNINLKPFLRDAIIGTKRFLFNESPECSFKGRLKVQIIYWIDKIFKYLFCSWIIYKIYIFLKSFGI